MAQGAPAASKVALRPALERNGGVWFGWSGKAVPRSDVEMHMVSHKKVTYVVTDLAEEDYQEYYNGFANRVLWPILHFRLDLAEFARRDLGGYMRVNEHFAAELEKIIESDDLIWVDLIPIADALRRRDRLWPLNAFAIALLTPRHLNQVQHREAPHPLTVSSGRRGLRAHPKNGRNLLAPSARRLRPNAPRNPGLRRRARARPRRARRRSRPTRSSTVMPFAARMRAFRAPNMQFQP